LKSFDSLKNKSLKKSNIKKIEDDSTKQYTISGEKNNIKIEPNEEVKVQDLIRGEVVINSSVIDDKVLFKSSDELPTYHLANVVDDYLDRKSVV
jgi:glutamyl-tRNA synthetase